MLQQTCFVVYVLCGGGGEPGFAGLQMPLGSLWVVKRVVKRRLAVPLHLKAHSYMCLGVTTPPEHVLLELLT